MATPERPTGQIAFLFTDIEGSTRLVDTLGTAAWRPLLERHRALVRAAIAGHGGFEQGTEGDSFFVVFTSVSDAVGMIADAQRALAAEPWPEGVAIRVRAGVHWGLGELDADGSYVGHDVHRAARVASAAHGGQVLLSEAAADLAEPTLPDGVRLRSLGAHRLKDLQPERIAQLLVDGLQEDFPPIRSLDARPNNLPVQLTPFVGRERELDELRLLLEASRLVTLTGPGGTGKSRLALQLAASVADRFPDGTWFVPLAAISDPSLVPGAIAAAIGIGEDPSRSRLDVIAAELEGRRTLLVLDNLEQLARAAADVADLLRRLPKLQVIATSRSPLHVNGEQEYPVPGLPSPVDLHDISPFERERLPPELRRQTPEALMAFEAVRLFVARAAAVRPGFVVTDGNAGDVAAIVAHLGGVPLAIELAAARVRFLTPAAIHERLEGRLDVIGTGSADLPERQRSLRGAIAWSYDLLDPPVRRLFERLSVFSGGFDLTSAESVAGDVADLGVDPLDGLAALVDHSLLGSGEAGGEPRFTFLEPIREFAAERLAAAGETDEIRRRHAAAYLALATAESPRLSGDRQRAALDRLETEHANLRAAIAWADATADAEVALGIVNAVWRFWQKRGHLTEARARVSELVARPWFAAAPAPLRARTHEVLGGIAYWQGDFPGARPHYEEALALWRAEGDRAEIANALYNLSFTFTLDTALDEAERGVAREIINESLALNRELGNDRGLADALWGLGVLYYFANDNEPAADAFEQARVLYHRLGERTQEAWALHQLGSARLKLGQLEIARPLLREGLRLFEAAGDVSAMTLLLDDLAAVAAAEGDVPRGARLQGLSIRLQASTGAALAGVVQWRFEELTRPDASRLLTAADLERFRAEGATLPLPTGVRYALDEIGWDAACAEAQLDSAATAAEGAA
ncbi:MAG TPA: tetratricopeptide repeat protein [Candidatus Limnocylindrales bacterium]|nr:tetratricopeptide repeat protein [Candidatus Limnocylindrales bacterium]